jgi:UDP-N-acetylmuramate--alanine ligase
VYLDLQSTLAAYEAFFAKIPSDGIIIYNADCANTAKIIDNAPGRHISVGKASGSTYRFTGLTVENGQATATYVHNNQTKKITLEIPGEYNAINALMALACSIEHSIGEEQVNASLLKFHGVDRRFQLMGNHGGAMFYDDYAHHPTEVTHTLKAAKEWFPGRRLVAIFQPHTYSRTKALMADFAKAFAYADKVIITEIFTSAREGKDPAVSSELLAAKIADFHPDVSMVTMNNLVEYINQIISPEDVLFTIGAGDVYEFHHNYFRKHA